MIGILMNKDWYLYTALVLVIIVLSISNAHYKSKVDLANLQNAKLEDRLKSQTIISTNKIIYKDRQGKSFTKYIPAEGKVTVNETKDGKAEVKVKDFGFTGKVGFGVYYSGRFEPTIDFKAAYFQRWSLGIGSSLNSPFVWVSYHLDQMPILHPENIELALGYGRDYSDFGHSKILVRL